MSEIKVDVVSDSPEGWSIQVKHLTKIVTPEMFLADPTGVNDSAAAIMQAVDLCRSEGLELKSYKGSSYRVDTPVDFRGVELDFKAVIKPTFEGQPQVILGGSSQDGQFNPNQNLHAVISPTSSPLAPNIRVIGAKGQNIKVDRTYYLQVWADTEVNAITDASSAYSHFHLRAVDKIELQSNKTTTGSLSQWINENHFHLQRTKEFIIDGTYTHNHNHIYGGTFENSGSLINIIRGSNNTFHGLRFENGGSVKFGLESRDNNVEYSWTSVNPIRPTGMLVEDLGIRNSLYNTKTGPVTTSTVIALTHEDLKPGYARPHGVGDKLSVTGNRVAAPSYSQIFLSDMIPFTSNTRISVKAEGNVVGGVRCKLIGYDANGVEISGSVDADYEGIGDGVGSFDASQPHLPSSNIITGVTLIPQPSGLSKAPFFKVSVKAGGKGLECTSFSVWVDSDSQWGTNRQIGAYAPVVCKGPDILLPPYVRASLSSVTIDPHSSNVVTKTWVGLRENSPINCSFGNEAIIPPELFVRAECPSDGVVVITVLNTSTAAVVLPSGTWVHMLAPGSKQSVQSI